MLYDSIIAYQLSTPPAKRLIADSEGLTFEKELIYVGDFRDKSRGNAFSVDEALLDHWAAQHAKMIAAGLRVPCPKTHTEDPEQNRAELISVSRRDNEKGLPALYGVMKFRDAQAAKLASSADVSVYVPPEQFDGKGNRYLRPIKHVAFTDYPVIPGLGKFKAIAASLTQEKDSHMSMKSLAEKLGVTVGEDDDEAAIEAAIAARFAELEAAAEETPAEEEEPEAETVSASHINMLRDNRSMKIDRLLGVGKITSAVAADLKKDYCADEALTLSLSHGPSSEHAEKMFTSLVAAFEKNEAVVSFKEKTRGQTLELAHTKLDAKENAIVADAERRAKKAAPNPY